jgi:hypothetical protein
MHRSLLESLTVQRGEPRIPSDKHGCGHDLRACARAVLQKH